MSSAPFPRPCAKNRHVLASVDDLAVDRSCRRCKRAYGRAYRRKRAGGPWVPDDEPKTRAFWAGRIMTLAELAEQEPRAWLRVEIEAELGIARRRLAELVRFRAKK